MGDMGMGMCVLFSPHHTKSFFIPMYCVLPYHCDVPYANVDSDCEPFLKSCLHLARHRVVRSHG